MSLLMYIHLFNHDICTCLLICTRTFDTYQARMLMRDIARFRHNISCLNHTLFCMPLFTYIRLFHKSLLTYKGLF